MDTLSSWSLISISPNLTANQMSYLSEDEPDFTNSDNLKVGREVGKNAVDFSEEMKDNLDQEDFKKFIVKVTQK